MIMGLIIKKEIKLRNLKVLVVLLVFVSSAWADQNENGMLVGKGLRVLWHDHNLTGTVGQSQLVAQPLTTEFGLKMTHKTRGQVFQSIFKKQGNGLAGTVEGLDVKGEKATVKFVVTQMDPKRGIIVGTINSRPFTVKISSLKMNGHHYVEPTFQVILGQRNYQFQMQKGQACMGCAVRISFALITTSLLNGLW